MGRQRATVWMCLLAAALGVQRLRTYDEPFERDIMTYAVIGHEMVLGNRLYADVLDNKPPALYAAFALAETLVGYGPAEVYLVNVVFALMAMGGLYAAAARAWGPAAGLTAALLWLLYAYDLSVHGNQPNAELCLNGLLALAFAGTFGARGRAGSWAGGALLALASLFKPIALVLAPLWAAAHVALAGRGSRRRALWHALALAVPAVVAWAGTCLYFWHDDRLALFKTVMFDFNRDYAGDLGENLVAAATFARLWPGYLFAALPLLALTVAGLAAGGSRDLRRWLPVLAYLAGAVVMVALPGRWWAHYYQLYLPPLVLGAACGLASLDRRPTPWGRRLRAAGLAAVGAFGLVVNLSQLALDGDAASRRKYRGRFLAVRETAWRASALLREGETVFMYGIEPGIYFHTRRRPVAQVLWLNHLTGPLRVPLRHTLRRQLREVRPDLIVRDTRFRTSWVPVGVADWMEQEYEALPAAPEMAPFELLVRRDSALRARAAGLL